MNPNDQWWTGVMILVFTVVMYTLVGLAVINLLHRMGITYV